MDTIKIGNRIATLRKEKGITQEELANHMGVSKPAVSKWESGQSYPDILLLPVLAAYFNVSIDELIGYEPQMTKEEINKLYQRLAADFLKVPYDKVLAECEEYLKKYFSCWQLQLQMGLLYLNHASLAENKERTMQTVVKALEIFQRVEKSSENVSLARQAVQLQAYCYLALEQPVEAIDLLEKLKEPMLHSEPLLVKAYQMKGDTNKALEYLQGYVYTNLMSILGAAPDFFRMYSTNLERMERFFQLYQGLSELFQIEELHPAMLFQLQLNAAFVYAGQGQKEKALDSLEYSLALLNKLGKGKLILKGNDIFDVLEDYFMDIEIIAEGPRNSEAIRRDFNNLVLHHPAFQILKAEHRYQNIVKQLNKE